MTSFRSLNSSTGVKCLPISQVSDAMGIVLHDQHAEILAIRAFNRFLLKESMVLIQNGLRENACVRRAGASEAIIHPFALADDIQIYMYCSDAPCGDASMELVMRSQPDSTPWVPPAADGTMYGRGYFSQLGRVRRKPGTSMRSSCYCSSLHSFAARPDAPPCFSKSCSDKLALKECLSLLNAQAALLIHPSGAYLTAIILPVSQHEKAATDRAFGASGRMAGLKPEVFRTWRSTYTFKPFNILTTDVKFDWSRSKNPDLEYKPSNTSAIWTPHFDETLTGGVLQGRKQSDPRAGSEICRRNMIRASTELADRLGMSHLISALTQGTYKDFKQGSDLGDRRQVKRDVIRDALPGWIPNASDDGFRLIVS